MKKKIMLAALAALSIPTAALADAGHQNEADGAYGQPGDPKQPARVVRITMHESEQKMAFIPSKIKIRKGEQIKFVIRNSGAFDHEIVLATLDENLKHAAEMAKNPDMEHDDPNAKRLGSKQSGEIVWKFTKAGEFDFSCLIPGHRESGMHGKIIVQ